MNQSGRALCREGSDVVWSRDPNRRWGGKKSGERVVASAIDA